MKKLSRIFVLLCLLMVLMCAISITAAAEEIELDTYDVQLGELIPGQPMPIPVAPEGANYIVYGANWSTDPPVYRENLIQSEKATVCEENQRYELRFYIYPKEGYTTSQTKNTVKINGIVESEHPHRDNEGRVTVYACFATKETVDPVNISVSMPRPGSPLSAVTFELAEPDKYYIHRSYIGHDSGPSTDTNIIEHGNKYKVAMTLRPNSAYQFADRNVTVFINGEQIKLSEEYWFELYFVYILDYTKTVSTVDFPAFPETAIPGPGGIQDITVPEGANYTLQGGWIDLRTGDPVETLTEGDIYTYAYMATVVPGASFLEDTVYTQNGEACEPMGDDQYRVIYRNYDLGAEKIDRVDVKLPTLFKGCTPGVGSVSPDANYTLMEILWAESTTGSFQDAQMVEVLDFGTTAYAIPVLAAKNGYIFSEDVKLYFNGQEVAIEDIYAEGPILEIAGACGTLTPPTGTGWYREDNTWAYYENGTKAVSRWIRDSIDWCYVDASGLMVKNGWAKDSAGWCYLGSSGYMVRSKWILWEGDYYYLNANGYMLVNTWMRDSIDWCYLGPTGRMLTNAWQKDSKGWCYVGADGYMIRNGWAVDSVGICRLGGDGYMVYNQWVKDSDGWRYVGSNGYMVISNWALDGGYWYAFDEYGLMFSDAMVKYMDKYYYLDANGRMLTNAWFKVENYWSYAGADGAVPLKTWVKDSKGWCYIGGKGFMLKDTWITENGKKYYVDSNGYMLRNTTRTFYTGYPIYRHETYYFDSNGVATYQSPF